MLLISISLWSQDTIRNLVISEARYDGGPHAYIELTNMGSQSIELSQFTYSTVRQDLLFKQEGNDVHFDRNKPNKDWGIID